MKERRAEGATPGLPSKEAEFDFQAAILGFSKMSVQDATPDITDRIKAYKKQDFFDMLSSDSSDRAEGKRSGYSPQVERTLNQDTFGAIALQVAYRRGGGRGGYGGRGRGGRARGGDGRGGGVAGVRHLSTVAS